MGVFSTGKTTYFVSIGTSDVIAILKIFLSRGSVFVNLKTLEHIKELFLQFLFFFSLVRNVSLASSIANSVEQTWSHVY